MTRFGNGRVRVGNVLVAAAFACGWMTLGTSELRAQSAGTQTQNPPATTTQPAQDIPDAPSSVQPPAPKPTLPPTVPDSDKIEADGPGATPASSPDSSPDSTSTSKPNTSSDPAQPLPTSEPPPSMPASVPRAAGAPPRNLINPADDLFKITVNANFVQVPVMVKDSDGRRVDGLLPKDFTVLENGQKMTLSYFTSDPSQLSVAILIDTGLPDVDVQNINQTYSALVGAFSAYDEVAIYTYSSTVSQVSDFTSKSARLAAVFNDMKANVRGRNNGPPVLNGPLASGGPIVNGSPVGGPTGVSPVNVPPREYHVLNDAILRAALDLSKRDRDRRKVIMVISDGKDLGSQANYRQVLKVLESHSIQVKAVVLDVGGLPGLKQIEKIHLRGQGYSDILPKYTSATGGGQVFDKLTRNTIEEAYAQITSEARNQYLLGYPARPTTGSSAYRTIEILVDRRGLKIFTKDGYYPTPSAR
jgi:VWFA-related protein